MCPKLLYTLKDIIQAPPPTYLRYRDLLHKPEDVHYRKILDGWEILDNGTLRCYNQKILDKSKGVVKDVISQAASNIFSGQNVIGISLPIRIFEARSLIERIGDWFGFGPIFLKEAGRIQDPLERFKLCIAFVVAGLYTSVQLLKPFNPILGETFQSFFEDGTRVYCEHSSHHPPISNFLVEDSENLYTISGFFEFKAKISSGQLQMRNDGPINIRFPDGQHVVGSHPTKKLGGMIWGDRTLVNDDTFTFEDKANGLKAVILFKEKKNDRFAGKLYRYKPELNLQKKEPTKMSEIKDI